MASNETLPPLFEPTPPERVRSTDRYVRTAACLIIGDEVLNGKTLDTNSNKMAKLCFELGIELKRVEVIPDDEVVIAEAARRLARSVDWVVTSGGIGPTPDDITYASLAKAFGNVPLTHDQETIRRMQVSAAQRLGSEHVPDEVTRARHRMALFPHGAEVIYPTREYWVPVVRVNGNVCVLPGVPRIFEGLLHAFAAYLPLDPHARKPIRCLVQVQAPLMQLLTRLTRDGKHDGVRVGSYPKWNAGVHISLIGYDQEVLDRYVAQVIGETGGRKL